MKQWHQNIIHGNDYTIYSLASSWIPINELLLISKDSVKDERHCDGLLVST